jgi:CBS domain-containing protein
MGMTDPNLAFIQLFEDLKSEINRRAGEPRSPSLELDRAAQRDKAVKKHQRRIRYIREIRDVIQHPQYTGPYPAVQITESFLDQVSQLLNTLTNPRRASSICVKRGDLFVVDTTGNVRETIDVMREKKFSHIPILDDHDILLGVFNEAAIFDYFYSDDVIDAQHDLTMSTILQHCSLDANHTETFRFVRPTAIVDDLIAQFTTVAGPSTRVGALFVTPSGNGSDPITGMVTPWDVLASA